MRDHIAYESPAITELGDFAAETGVGLGDEYEPSWPIADRP
ncbi:lasso RiPP family leader peptide-containing protein [Nonomuraea candida]|nr:lasso RiPP family leader peptide-containing protein [Nonomuraea candida]